MTRAIGSYEIVHALKEGGMGEVLLARWRGPGGVERLVAIKTIRAELAGAAAVRAMFLDEAGILSRLGHPAVAAVHDFGEDGKTLFLVMEYVAGISFRGLIDGRPPPAIAARAIIEACRGLHAAHEVDDLAGNRLGVVHRDISPENLMLGFDGHVKVIDFGIALVKGRQAPVTELGTVKGKPPYMSPEQVKNESIDRQSDVWSVAVVLHELLTGQSLFDGDSIYAVARAVEHAEIAPPSRTAGSLPPGLDAAVMRGLERDRTRRTPTAAALAEELEAVVMASGGESLEAWAERELAAPRQAHRGWLTSVLAGTAEKIGRPTGAVTALPAPLARTPVAEVPAPPVTDVAPPGQDDDELDAAPVPRRGRAIAIVAAVFVVMMAAVAIYLSTRTPAATAPIDEQRSEGVPAEVPDGPHVASPTSLRDAGLSADAGATLPPVHDARSAGRSRDAAPASRPDARAERPPPPDAAPVSGVAYLTATASPFANIRVDDQDLGSTPKFRRKISAGRHRIMLTDPATGAVVAEKVVDLAPGEHVTISR